MINVMSYHRKHLIVPNIFFKLFECYRMYIYIRENIIACLFSVHNTIGLSRHEHKVLKELQADTSTVILPAGKGRSTIILNHEDYLEKWSISST